MSIWDDFLAFDLRREDRAYKKPLKKWGEIFDQYRFTQFSGKKLPCELLDLLNEMYKEQATSGNKDFVRHHSRFRAETTIESDLISRKMKKALIEAISDKEQALTYLTTHYSKMDKKSRPIEMITFAFHLPDNWHQEEKMQRNAKKHEHFIPALNELKKRFTSLKKKIISDRLYTAACGYSRLILINEQSEPFYVVNFFFSKKKQSIIDGNIPLDIYDKWISTGEKTHRYHERVCYYIFKNASRPLRESDDRLFVLSSQAMPGAWKVNDRVVSSFLINTSPDFPDENNRKGYLALLRLQAQIYNTIPGVRSLSNSSDFTYLNAVERKKRKSKKDSGKSRVQVQPSQTREPSMKVTSAITEVSTDDLFHNTLPSNMEEHLSQLKKLN